MVRRAIGHPEFMATGDEGERLILCKSGISFKKPVEGAGETGSGAAGMYDGVPALLGGLLAPTRMSACSVRGPTIPSGTRPFCCWKLRIALRVCVPIMPSTANLRPKILFSEDCTHMA